MGAPLMIAATAMQGVGALAQAEGQAQAAEYQQRVAYNNSVLATKQAEFDEKRQRIKSKKELGAMRAAYGASGVQIDASALDVLEESAAAAEMDALNIRHGGQLRAIGYRNEAAMAGYEAEASRRAGAFGAASAVLGGASKIYGNTPSSSKGTGVKTEMKTLRANNLKTEVYA